MTTATMVGTEPTPAPRKYVRFFEMHRGFLFVTLGVLAGGWWMWLGFVANTILSIFQQGKDDLSVDKYEHPWILNASLFLGFPMLLLVMFAFAWMLGAPGTDLFGFGQFVQSTVGYDIFAARAGTHGWHLLGGTLSVGLALGASIVIGHELTHRTHDFWSMLVGRWMLAAPADASFAIEHVYGHHVHVSTPRDPATAQRGQNIFAFILRSIIFGNVSGWRIERERLHKLGHFTFSWRNRMIRGYLMTAVYAAFFAYAAGALGILLYLAAALYGKVALERINYVEHYGLVRVPGEPVMPRHSWNSNHGAAPIFNLSRHSHHHHDASVHFQDLLPMDDQPEMPFGYTKMSYACLVPSVWRRMIVPKLIEWDQRYASPEERKLAREANLKSGIPELVEFAKTQQA